MYKTMMISTLVAALCAFSSHGQNAAPLSLTGEVRALSIGSTANEPAEKKPSHIYLDDEKTKVRFVDGDTIKVLEGDFKRSYGRIEGINSLETYGAVHSFEKTSADYLLTIAHAATAFAQKGDWHCYTQERRDTYGRILVTCDDFAKAILAKGLAHAYSINDKPAPKEYLAAQKKAQKAQLGMWKYYIPTYIISSLHSKAEGARENYNRLISTKDGTTKKMQHKENYEICQNVCIENNASCMIYVPFQKRYTQRPYCLQ